MITILSEMRHLGVSQTYGVPGTIICESEEFSHQLDIQRIIVENSFSLLKGEYKIFYHESGNGHTAKAMKILVGGIVIHTLIIQILDPK